jgi:hypothetical protein
MHDDRERRELRTRIGRLRRRIDHRIRRGLSRLGVEACREVWRIWADSTPDRTKAEKNPPPGGGADDG